MNSTELIALAERRFEELGGEERAGEWRSWYRGFLEGFMSRAPSPLLPLVKELLEALRHASRDLHYEPSPLARGGTIAVVDAALARADKALEEER